MKHKEIKIAVGVGVALVLGFVLYKAFIPPTLTIRSFNATDGTGTYEWNGATGNLAPGIGVGGSDIWGWAVQFGTYTAGTGYNMTITKNGTVQKSFIVNQAGTY